MLVSGTAPVYDDGSCPDDAGAQTMRCLEIIASALAKAGSDLRHVVRTAHLRGPRPLMRRRSSKVHAEVFGDVRPAATMVVVAALLDPRWRVELEAEAQL